MSETAREIEGTWEEVSARGREFSGRRVRLTFLDTPAAAIQELIISRRPQPTPEQAARGIVPSATGTGSFEDVMALVDSLPISHEDAHDLWDTIAENRSGRRQAAVAKAYDPFLESGS